MIVTGDIPWNVEGGALSEDRTRGVFAVNAGGMSQIYLMDTATREYAPVSVIPTGLAGGMEFSPDGTQARHDPEHAQDPERQFRAGTGRRRLWSTAI